MSELLIDVREAARRLSIGRTRMYELLTAGIVKSVHLGKLRRVVVADLESYVRSLSGHAAEVNLGEKNRT